MAPVYSDVPKVGLILLAVTLIFAVGCGGPPARFDVLSEASLRTCALPVADVDTTRWTEITALDDQFSYFLPSHYVPDGSTGQVSLSDRDSLFASLIGFWTYRKPALEILTKDK